MPVVSQSGRCADEQQRTRLGNQLGRVRYMDRLSGRWIDMGQGKPELNNSS